MKYFLLFSLFLATLLSSCNRGVFVTIDSKQYDYGKNTEVTLQYVSGKPPGYMLDIKTFKRSVNDSSFFLLGVSQANEHITTGNYSFPNTDRTNLPTSTITFYNKKGVQYMSGGDEVYGTTFIITSLNKKRAKGWFKSKLGDIKEDTATLNNSINVNGRFNVSLKNAKK